MCFWKGFSEEHTFSLYINCFDWNENIVDSTDYLNCSLPLQRKNSTGLEKGKINYEEDRIEQDL